MLLFHAHAVTVHVFLCFDSSRLTASVPGPLPGASSAYLTAGQSSSRVTTPWPSVRLAPASVVHDATPGRTRQARPPRIPRTTSVATTGTRSRRTAPATGAVAGWRAHALLRLPTRAERVCPREPVSVLCVSVVCATSPLLASPAFTPVTAVLPCVTSDRCGAVTKTYREASKPTPPSPAGDNKVGRENPSAVSLHDGAHVQLAAAQRLGSSRWH